jgi:hypothetical protein
MKTCGFTGKIYEVIDGQPRGKGNIIVHAWWPWQRDRHGVPKYPWQHTERQGFNPTILETTVTDDEGMFTFTDLPLLPKPTDSYCIGFGNPQGYKGGGESQWTPFPGQVREVSWQIRPKVIVSLQRKIAEAMAFIKRMGKLARL